jgi:hypothetical protein
MADENDSTPPPARPSAEQVRQLLNYEPDTGRLVWRVTSGRAIAGREAGGISKDIGYRRIRLLKSGIFLTHHLVWLILKGEWPKRLDHIDGDRLNNRIENLRECTQSQNLANTGKLSTNTSGIKGVNWHKASQRWLAQIKVRGKQRHLGVFKTKEEAGVVYAAAAKEAFGDFARTEDFIAPAPIAATDYAKPKGYRPTVEELRETFEYVPDTGELRWRMALSFRGPIGSIAGQIKADGYRRLGLFGRQYYAHVVIWAMVTGSWPVLVIHHVDANRSNNRWANLQEITQAENVQAAYRRMRR